MDTRSFQPACWCCGCRRVSVSAVVLVFYKGIEACFRQWIVRRDGMDTHPDYPPNLPVLVLRLIKVSGAIEPAGVGVGYTY